MLSLTVTLALSPLNAFAAPQYDEQFFSGNNILFWNPNDNGSVCSTEGSVVTELKGENNGEKIYNFWTAVGMSPAQSAGITGSMQHEGGFSPFRQEMSQTWPAGGWGIAQFTGGQRQAATAYVQNSVGLTVFTQYYKNDFGGAVLESNGFKPVNVPLVVNDQFLLAQLNYLLDHIKELSPNNVRTSTLKNDYGLTVPAGEKLFDYLKGLNKAEDSAIAWTYLYEYPANIKSTAAARGESAKNIATLYSGGVSSSCGGGLQEGGMNLEQAKKFVDDYKNNPSNVQYIGGAGKSCPGGPLSNCVSFSVYFLNKYTDIKTTPAPGNGSTVASNIISKNPGIANGHSPQPYAIFSTASGSQMCGNVKCGHTGVILGVDTERGKVIVGEAGCGAPASWDTAREYPLSQFDSGAYTYVYLGDKIKGDIK